VNKCLQILDLSHTDMGTQGIQALARSLSTNRSLHTLLLRKVGARDEDLQALCEAAVSVKEGSPSTLTSLDVSSNQLTAACAPHLTTLLSVRV
jgi:hypothetical protein